MGMAPHGIWGVGDSYLAAHGHRRPGYGLLMGQNQKYADFGLLLSGIGLVVGSFSAWISVLIVTISGTSGPRGYVTLASGLIIISLASSQLWPNLLDERIGSKLSRLTIGAVIVSAALLAEVAVRIRQVAGQVDSINGDVGVSQSADQSLGEFGQAIDDFTKSLTEAFTPRLAMGWYVSSLSVVSASVFIFLQRRGKQGSMPEATSE